MDYRTLCEQANGILEAEPWYVSALSNLSALIMDTMADLNWAGFYLVKNGELTLGPFQGPVACYHIGYGKGVCGAAWKQESTLVVPDVEEFPGHIACSSLSRSEIVVPLFNRSHEVVGVLDIDSKELATFDETDKVFLERLCAQAR